MMKRDECLKSLAPHIKDEIVVAAYSTAFDWLLVRPHDLNYTCVGAMGLASSHGLGLALGRPDRKVIVFDGDGSLLMNLGSLVTAAELGLKNFFHFVFRNGSYEANGGHPIPGRNTAQFAGLAKAAGYRGAHRFDTLEALERSIGEALAEEGPVFIELDVIQGAQAPMDYGDLYRASRRSAFKTTLAAVGASA